MDRNVTGCQVVFQTIENSPPVYIWQSKVQGNGVGPQFPSQVQGVFASPCNQRLEVPCMGFIQKDFGEVQIIFHDQENTVARLDAVAIVVDLPGDFTFRKHRGRQSRVVSRDARGRGGGFGYKSQRKIQRESTAKSKSTRRKANFTSEQSCDLPADRQAKASPSESPTRCPVSLLEGLEDDVMLIRWNTNARVADRELKHRASRVQDRMGQAPTCDGI